MNKPIMNKGGSLLERAAEVYDFSAHFRAPVIPADDLPPVPPVEPVETIVPLRATPTPVVPTAPVAHREAAIDRALLVENGLLVPGAPVGVLAEEFRLAKRQLLLTARRLAATDPAKARTMLVCSPKPGDGKTYCAVNLAISMAAERDLRVLLVDADFAKPSVMSRLGVEDGPGLLDALADPSIDIESCVVGTDIPNLSLLPAGAGSTSDTELIASDRTPALIARLLAADPQRVVIFDSPPALAASPASVLALHVGQIALVVRADRTIESDIRDAVHRLEGCDEIQLLLNSVSYAPGGARFGSYYGQGDGQ
ncbi:AAA family ATPase [Sphingomonas panacisoli]|uniref:AAA family ATPase n=1 Tax=Sphingomonas panacisoli TaxID=1813879 RepID=A0A5B8LKZ1_9SPHN|nr:AAA family ATPase [Sphingomonas panacisoli]QDZ07720.1 AAA family ATPase [Sphingomonas panacisoli]